MLCDVREKLQRVRVQKNPVKILRFFFYIYSIARIDLIENHDFLFRYEPFRQTNNGLHSSLLLFLSDDPL